MTHVDDGDLMRLLDGECEAEERASLEAHVVNCQECEARERQLAGYAVAVRQSLGTLDRASRRSRWGAWQLKAAVAVLALTGASLAAQPARAWMATEGRLLWTALTHGPAKTDQPGPYSTSLWFRPGLGAFTVQVAANQTVGTLTVAMVAGDSARLHAQTSGPPSFTLLPDGFRIANDSTSKDSYDLTVPARVSRVKVMIGSEPPLWLDAHGGTTRWEIVLGRGRSGSVRAFH